MHYLMALLGPSGRITRPLAFVMSLPFALVIAAVPRMWIEPALADGHEVNQWLLGGVLVCFWPLYCLTSRLLQNGGAPGVIAAPLYALAAFDFLVVLDPSVLGVTEEDIAGNLALLCQASALSWYLVRAAFIYGLVMGSDDEENAYGPPFGHDTVASKRRIDRSLDSIRAQYGVTANGATSTATASSGNAGRIEAAASGQRAKRRHGFGQR